MSTCEDCEHPCGRGGCTCPEECPARRSEPVPPEVVAADEQQEAVARALWEALPDSGYGRKPWADLSKTTHFLYRRLAAAAIAAYEEMRR